MSDSQTSTTLPPFRDLEVDKAPHAWVLTYRLPDDVALRLKIEHGSITDPDAFIAEIRLGPNNEFQRIHAFELAPCVIAEPGWPEEEVADSWDELPNIYTAEFAGMISAWFQLTLIADLRQTIFEHHESAAARARATRETIDR